MNNLSDLRFKLNPEIQQYMLDIANLKIQLLQLDKNDKEYIKIDRKIKELKGKFIKEFQNIVDNNGDLPVIMEFYDSKNNKVTLSKIQSLSIGFLGDEKGTENCIIISNTIGMHENATVTIEGN